MKSQAGVPAGLCRVETCSGHDRLQCPMFLEAVESPGKPLDTWGAVKAGDGEGGAEHPFPFSCRPCVGAHEQPLPAGSFRSKKVFSAKGEGLSCMMRGIYRLSSLLGPEDWGLWQKGGHSQGASALSSPCAPAAAADGWWLPPLQKPFCSGPACPNLPPSPGKVLAGSLPPCEAHLLATLLSARPLRGSLQTAQQLL